MPCHSQEDLLNLLSSLSRMPQTRDVQRVMTELRQQLDEDHRIPCADNVIFGHLRGPWPKARSSPMPPRSSGIQTSMGWAPPRRATLDIPGWKQQARTQPWPPVSPDTIATEGDHRGARFSWIVHDDAKYVERLLDHTDVLTSANLWEMTRFFGEHYMRST